MKSEQIELVCQYKDGKEIKENSVTIFAQKKSVKFNEFYAAVGVGLKPSLIFNIYPEEFSLADVNGAHATHIRYRGQLHPIIRAYEKNRFEMELSI